ncbi:MAG TPA: L-seryl-tRNA(Sec) selenium transferase [Longimicrobiales bacterium]|nr:L-seryl-tRNA(Sec) selenium transferase [Longimicrobiales bacterium]
MADPRRELPSVDRLLGSRHFAELLRESPRSRVTAAIRALQAELRARVLQGDTAAIEQNAEWYALAVRDRLEASARPTLRRVVNGTGVILHTNLGRAPLAADALAALSDAAAGYSNLEYDIETGSRGSRYDHCRALLAELTGFEDALVVNNNAAALVLALNTLARSREAIVSRGELVEIGGSFRIPEIMERSGARLHEVGATNRTHLADYEAAITNESAVILKVHQSNFRVSGFTAEVSPEALAKLARKRGLAFVFDLGSGLLMDLQPFGLPREPRPQDARAAGAELVVMSGDKLLGGPQAGIILGTLERIAALRRNPLCRALRVDKLTIAALEATLRLYLDPDLARVRVPVLRMLTLDAEVLHTRARALAARLQHAGVKADAVASSALVGGGAFPDVELPSAAVCIGASADASAIDGRLRRGQPPVIGRFITDRIAVDLRAVSESELGELERAIIDAFQT